MGLPIRLTRALIVVAGFGLPLTAIAFAFQHRNPNVAAFTAAELLIVGFVLLGIRRYRRRLAAAPPGDSE